MWPPRSSPGPDAWLLVRYSRRAPRGSAFCRGQGSRRPFRLEKAARGGYTNRVTDLARKWGIWLRGTLAGGLVFAAVVLPVEITLTSEEPVAAPHPSVSLLLGSSCLLLFSSSLTLRRDEAARQLTSRQADGA